MIDEENGEWKTVRVRQETVDKLERIRKKEGLRSIAAAIQYLANEAS